MSYKDYETLNRLYTHEKMSQDEIGKMYGVDRKSISYWLNKHQIPKVRKQRPKQTDDLDINEVVEVLNGGMLINDFCKLKGINRSALSRFLNANGYNFKNSHVQRQRHSELMRTEKNPTLGTNRPKDIIDALNKAKREKARKRWNKIDNYKDYARTVRDVTYRNAYNTSIPSGFEIDHIFSVWDCWNHNVPVEMASHINNTRLITVEENKKKGKNSLVSYEEFLSMVSNSTTIESTR